MYVITKTLYKIHIRGFLQLEMGGRKTRARQTHKALGRETRDTTAANNSRKRTLPA